MKPILKVLALFILVQALGMMVSQTIREDIFRNPYAQGLIATGETNDFIYPLLFIGIIILAEAVLILELDWVRLHELAFRIVEFGILGLASSFVFYSMLRLFFDYPVSTPLALVLAAVFTLAEEFRRKTLKNAEVILAAAGAGVILGFSFGIGGAFVFLMLLALYDYFAVFGTHHMEKIANFIIDRDMGLAIGLSGTAKEKEDIEYMGVGDMITPVIFETALSTAFPEAVGIVAAGATVAMGAYLFITWKGEKTWPAIPPVVAGMLIAFFAGTWAGLY